MSGQTVESHDGRLGFFGKMPGAGDFVSRGLSPETVEIIDAWASRLTVDLAEKFPVAMSHWEKLPMIRFVLSPGVIATHTWAGVLSASFDAVGRKFPLIVFFELRNSTDMAVLRDARQSWFTDVEDALLVNRAKLLEPDKLFQVLQRISPSATEELVHQQLSQPTISSSTDSIFEQLKTGDDGISIWWAEEVPNAGRFECNGIDAIPDIVKLWAEPFSE